jgi:tetratricopeptide (TPR) repeat protein
MHFSDEPLPMIGVHKHLCCFYKTHKEMEQLWIPFLAEGLRRKEKCILVVGDDYSVETASSALVAAGIDVPHYQEIGQLSIVDNEGFPTSTRATANEITSFWSDRINTACGEGFKSLRAAAQMTWLPAAQREADVVPEYEFLVNKIFPELPISAICMYDKTLFSEYQLERVTAVHPHVARVEELGDAVCNNTREFVIHQALKAGQAAHRLNPATTDSYATATALLEQGKFEEAQQLYADAASSAESTCAKVSALLGVIQSLRAQGKRAEAIELEDQATALLLNRKI